MSVTLNQTIFLLLLITIGYILVKLGLLQENTEKILSKLENYVFIPALVLGTFIDNFTLQKLMGAKDILLVSFIIELVVIPISFLLVRVCTKDEYIRRIFLYGLCFSNFGFMGNAIVSNLFPDIFLEYLLFTIVLWIAIYIWGVPVLLMDNHFKNTTIKQKLKPFVNPMIIAMLIGMLIGLTEIKVPSFANNLLTSLGDCMSPIAMLLTGMTIARKRFFDIIKIKSIYLVTIIRLIIYPLVFIGITKIINVPETIMLCGLCSLAMPLGLNTIVIPAAYDNDTTVASGMALVSHVLSCITIPIMFFLLKL